MVTGRMIFAATLLGLGLSAAAATTPPAKKKPVPAAPPAADTAAAKIVQNCDAHKFETVVHEMVDGQPHQSKVKLCGKTGQSDSEWIGTLKDAISKVDAVLFVTPEYNRSIPGALKNAIDWASRPWGQNSFARKPSAVIGASAGPIGTAVAQQSLKQVLAFCNSPLMNAVEAYIHYSPEIFGPQGEVHDPAVEAFLRSYMQEFHEFIARVLTVLPKDEL